MNEAFRVIGAPCAGGVLVVSDHASNRVPPDIDLGISAALLEQHIAVDIGVAAVGALMARADGYAAFHGNVSRLVCDYNRDGDHPGLVPAISDGHPIPGNALDAAGIAQRRQRFFDPYHDALAAVLEQAPPRLILSLHSYTPRLSNGGGKRPWHCGVLYNEDDRAARLAIPLLEAEGLIVGDQLPYSGKLLNATMNRHAEAHGRLYLGIEVRQDEIADGAGQARWAELLRRVCDDVSRVLG